MQVYEIPRNDLKACERFYALKGYVTGDEIHIMAMLQDNATAFRDLTRAWIIR